MLPFYAFSPPAAPLYIRPKNNIYFFDYIQNSRNFALTECKAGGVPTGLVHLHKIEKRQ